MDELQAVRDVFNGSAVPTAAHIADARARLTALTGPRHAGHITGHRTERSAEGTTERVTGPAAERPTERAAERPAERTAERPTERPLGRTTNRTVRRRPKWAISGLAAAATAAVAAVTLVAASTGNTTRPAKQPPAAAPQAVGAQRILLAASDEAARQPATTGRYWHTSVLEILTNAYVTRGKKVTFTPGPVRDGSTDSWWASSKDDDVVYSQSPGDSSLTDKQLASYGETRAGSWLEQRTTVADKASQLQVCTEKHESCGHITWAQAGALASNTRALNAAMFWTNPNYKGTDAENDLRDAFTFLTSHPLPPKTQAAAYRVLAGLRGVRSAGPVKLLDGQAGTGIGTVEGPGGEFVIVFDSSDRLIGTVERSRLRNGKTQIDSRSVLTNGWTNDSPRHPA
jgi:hypothetical protein